MPIKTQTKIIIQYSVKIKFTKIYSINSERLSTEKP